MIEKYARESYWTREYVRIKALKHTGVIQMSKQSIFTQHSNKDALSLTILAAKGWKIWGRYAAELFAIRHGIDLRLVRLARQFEATKGI